MNLTDLFGTGATITAGNLSIPLSALAAAHGFNGAISSITPAQIFALIVKQVEASTSEKTLDPTYGVTVARSFDSIVDRGTESQIGYGFTATLYTRNDAVILDPDNVI